MLNDFMMCDDESDIDQNSSLDDSVCENIEELNELNFRGKSSHRTKIMKNRYDPSQDEFLIQKNDNNKLNKPIINTNTKTWKLVERIYERNHTKGTNSKTNFHTATMIPNPINKYKDDEYFESEIHENKKSNENLFTSMEKNPSVNVINGSKHAKQMMKLKTFKKLENDDVPIISDESPSKILLNEIDKPIQRLNKSYDKPQGKSKFKKLSQK